jgi:hypothetical protein
MLNLLDETIRTLLDSKWGAGPPAKPEFFFTVPNEKWQADVTTNGAKMRLNIYMYEMRENRDWRRAPLDPTPLPLPDRRVVFSRPPVYLDCHFLISAWSPAEDSTLLNPIEDEHATLARALRILYQNPEVVPSVLGVNGAGPVFDDGAVVLTVAPPETPRVLNDFWSTMKLPWRPAIQLVAMAPLDLVTDSAPSTRVITLIKKHAFVGSPPGEEWIQIGGWVVDGNNADKPVPGATIRHVDTSRVVTADDEGRWVMTGLQAGNHTFVGSAAGFANNDTHGVAVPNGPLAQHVFRLT